MTSLLKKIDLNFETQKFSKLLKKIKFLNSRHAFFSKKRWSFFLQSTIVFSKNFHTTIFQKLLLIYQSLNPLLSSIVDNNWRKDPFKGFCLSIQ